MAAPTVYWKLMTGDGTESSSITTLDHGTIDAGTWGDAHAVVAHFDGNDAEDLRFWANDLLANQGSMDAASGWSHHWSHSTGFTSADTFDDATKASWSALDESEPGSSNISDVGSGSDTEFIYLAIKPPADAADGTWDSFSYRLSYKYS